MDFQTWSNIIGAVAGDGRSGFKYGLLSFDTIRSIRVLYLDISLHKAQDTEKANIKGKCFEHVNTYAAALKKVAAANPGIFDDSDLF